MPIECEYRYSVYDSVVEAWVARNKHLDFGINVIDPYGSAAVHYKVHIYRRTAASKGEARGPTQYSIVKTEVVTVTREGRQKGFRDGKSRRKAWLYPLRMILSRIKADKTYQP
jgi:hypothetical protein